MKAWKGAEAAGGTGDTLARGGEASTVVVSAERHAFCGGRIQIVKDRHGGGTSARHCRGCGRRVDQ